MLFLGILKGNGNTILKAKVNDSHFQYQPVVSQNARLLQIWWFQPNSVVICHTEKPNFLQNWVKMTKVTLKVKVNDCHFQYQVKVSHDACLVQIWCCQLKFMKSYCADKVKSTDGRTDRQTQATTIPFGLKGQGVRAGYTWHLELLIIESNICDSRSLLVLFCTKTLYPLILLKISLFATNSAHGPF